MKILYGLVIIASLLILTQSTSWNFCKDGPRLPIKSLWIYNCPGPKDLPCPLYIGNDLQVKVNFEVLHNATVLRAKIKARKIGINIKASELSEVNGCTTLTEGQCPLKKGDVVASNFSLPTKVSVPWSSFECNMEVSLHNENDQNLGCFSLPVIIYK